MLELLTFVVLVVASGYALRKGALVRPELAKDLNHVVFYLTLPPLVFLALHGATLSWRILAMPALGWGFSLVGLGLAFGLGRLFGLTRAKTGALAVALTFGNTTFFGYPIIQGFYGQDHLTLAIFYDLLGTTLAVNTAGTAVAAAFGTGALPWTVMARRLLLFPPIWALVAGLALHGVPLPPLLETVLGRVGALTVPLIMLSIGLSLQFRHWRADWPLVTLTAVARLALLPLGMWAVVKGLGLPTAYQQTAVLLAAMPTMFYSLTLALLFGLEVNLVVNAIMVTTLLSFVTLPIWHQLLGG